MTIREAAKNVISPDGGIYAVTHNKTDIIEFGVYDMDELEDSWNSYCNENGISPDCVDAVEEL